MLSHLSGPLIHKIVKSVGKEGLPFSYTNLKNALMAHFKPLANPNYDQFLLRQARQQPEESVDAFYAHLRELASTCTLLDNEDEIHSQFIQGCSSAKLRESILQVHGMSRATILTLGRSKKTLQGMRHTYGGGSTTACQDQTRQCDRHSEHGQKESTFEDPKRPKSLSLVQRPVPAPRNVFGTREKVHKCVEN
ncbi:hypothetical protein NDU88_002227 [Pleurodeles waltl]|uniref:Retrotransposon gag domain-containing protein n=1 Tax=Pleurodeles waltl TaxID=8319 RepID=A0AAV7P9C5_PLEWA|nr:hypothetical protein NDU88_002227 [Pleurodeles waltl]